MSGYDGGSVASSSRLTSPIGSSSSQNTTNYNNGQQRYMHTHSQSQSSTSTHITPSLLPAQSSQQAPTLITYGSKSVRARVDREVPIDEIIRQLCASPQLAIQDPPVLFCLRDSGNNDLITADNIHRKLGTGIGLKLVASPVIEAADTIEKLLGNDKQQVKQATFALRGLVREDAFVTEFLARSGVAALASVIQTNTGNTLAYALNAMQSLLDLDEGWDNLTLDFVEKIILIMSNQTLVNIVRPALAILKRLIISDQPSFGFNNIWPLLAREDGFFKALAYRITREGDKLLTGGALALLNAIMKSISKDYFLETVEKLESYNFRKAVISLIENHAEDVTPHILQFQQNCANIWHQQQFPPVDLYNSRHLSMLQSTYSSSGLAHQQQQNQRNASQSYISDTDSMLETDYRKLGFSSDLPELEKDFSKVGLFGLYGLYHTASNRSEDFSRLVLEQVNRPDTRRCPIALVSLEVSRLLADQFDISGSLASASFQPFLLDYFRVHLIVMELFIRIFQDSGASAADFGRVSTLVMSQIRLTLGRESLEYQGVTEDGNGTTSAGTRQPKSYFALKQELEDAKYEDIRDRQMKEMEVEDDLLSKLPVRNLRDRLYRESFDFVRSQRINCLHSGAWFSISSASIASLSASQRTRTQAAQPNAPSKYRFYRLAANKRYLHYLEASEKKIIRSGVDDLPERIDLSTITELISGQAGQASNGLYRTQSGATSPPLSATTGSLRSPTIPSSKLSSNPLSITLLSQDSTIAEIVAPNTAVHSEWLDGLNLLLPDGYISTKETTDYIQILTDIGVKIKLLDLSGERLEIPTALPVPIVPPPSVMFYYAE